MPRNTQGLVELPRRREQRRRGPTSIHYTKAGRKGSRREGNLSDVAPVTLGLVAHAEERALWRELVERYWAQTWHSKIAIRDESQK